MAKMMQYPLQLFHKHRRESAVIPDHLTHKKMEPKWIQDYDVHKMRGEIEWLTRDEISWKHELPELERKAIEARELRVQEVKEKEERAKIDAKKAELLKKYEEKKKRESQEEEIRRIAKELGEEIPEYVKPAPVVKAQPKPEPIKDVAYNVSSERHVDLKMEEHSQELKPKKKLFGKQKVDDGT